MKANALNYRLILKFIVPIILLLVMAAYQLAFKKTWESYQQYRELNQADQQADALSISPTYSASREQGITTLYTRYVVDTLKWKNQLWNQCAVLAQKYDCSVQGFPEWRSVKYGKSMLLQQEIVFAGDFHNLLRLQSAMDTIKNSGLTGGLSYSRNARELKTTLRIRQLGLQTEQTNRR